MFFFFPGPPRDVIAQPLNETAVKLTWDEPLDRNGPVLGYFVDFDELNEEDEFVWQKSNRQFSTLVTNFCSDITGMEVEFSTKEAILVNLNADTKYSARICAYNSKGDGVSSKAKTFRTPPLKPLPPKNFKIDVSQSENSEPIRLTLTASWDEPENMKNLAKTYILRYKLKEDENYEEIVVHNTTRLEIDGARAGRTYDFRIVALYNGQEGDEGANSITTPVAA
uniref:Fibronectin type-III domain-containing protein n=1 Tax=Romanomermis culicivorax TaxID=13658 RepID=A0A915JTC2_ROMCU